MLNSHVCDKTCTDTGTRWDHKPCPYCSTEKFEEWAHRMADHCPVCMKLICRTPADCARSFDDYCRGWVRP